MVQISGKLNDLGAELESLYCVGSEAMGCFGKGFELIMFPEGEGSLRQTLR
jgi:hypothetical protein